MSADRLFWGCAWSMGLALGWLLPNHYVPWISFHFDAWVATWLMVGAVATTVADRSPRVQIHWLALLCLGILSLAWVQYASGLLPFAGQAWLATAYLLGLFVALVWGARSELASPGQLADHLFLAIGIAAIVSVGLALYQWLDVSFEPLDLWVMELPNRRAFANFIQPNQLATFLVWALLACAWGAESGRMGPRVALLLALFLVVGIVLTQSRTAVLEMLLLLGASVVWRRLWLSRGMIAATAGLTLLCMVGMLILPWIGSLLLLDPGTDGVLARGSNELRWPAYRMLMDALFQHPWRGYGWGQTFLAQLEEAERHPFLHVMFMQAHNLVLDLLLWFGLPLGGLLTLALVAWFMLTAVKVGDARSAILWLFVAVVAVHAQLEFPLHYGYMLWPTGIVVGILNARLGMRVVARLARWQWTLLLALCCLLLGVLVRDYLRVEESLQVLRFERARIAAARNMPLADVLLLDHMNAYVGLGRTQARSNMSPDELDTMARATLVWPGYANLYTYTKALALNQRVPQAQTLVNKLARFTPVLEYNKMRAIWRRESSTDARMQAVTWPRLPTD